MSILFVVFIVFSQTLHNFFGVWLRRPPPNAQELRLRASPAQTKALFSFRHKSQCPLQCLQSQPHCSDLPFFLSLIIPLTISATIPANTAVVTIVPIDMPISFTPVRYNMLLSFFYFASAFLPIRVPAFCLPSALCGRRSRYKKPTISKNAAAVPGPNVPVVNSIPNWYMQSAAA